MTTAIPHREHVLRCFDQHDRAHPGAFISVDSAGAGPDRTATCQAIRELAYQGLLALTTMPVGVVDNGSLVRITNKGRAVCGESAADRAIRNRVLRYINTHATIVPTSIENCPHELEITALEASRAIVSLAEDGLITHKRHMHQLGLVQIRPSGHKVAAALKG